MSATVENLPYANQLTTCLPHAESELRERIAQAIGAASACWDNLEGAGVFQSERACAVVDDLVQHTLRLTSMGEPSLGCATTGQLLDELRARVDLDYRTVDDTPL